MSGYPGFQRLLEKQENGPLVPRRQGLVPAPAAQPRFGLVICQTFLTTEMQTYLCDSDIQQSTLLPLTIRDDQIKQRPLIVGA